MALTWLSWFPFLPFNIDSLGREVFHGDPKGKPDETQAYNVSEKVYVTGANLDSFWGIMERSTIGYGFDFGRIYHYVYPIIGGWPGNATSVSGQIPVLIVFSHHSTSLAPILPSSTHQEFHGKRPSMSFCEEMNVHGEDELSDDGSQLGEKKRRFNIEQVRTLEKNFELGNKLEPERKMQLARALGLQPRQIAIWFQNRRARWKTKQLEKDYDLLKRHFDAVRDENHALQAHNHILHAKIMELKTREQRDSINLNKDTEASCSNRSQSSSEIKLDISRTPAVDSPLSKNPNRPGFLGLPSLNRSNGVAQLFQNFPGPETHCPKTDQNGKEESLPNVFCGMDDQTGFWPWIEQQNFN